MKRPWWQSLLFFALGLLALAAAWQGVTRLNTRAAAQLSAAKPVDDGGIPAVSVGVAEASPPTRVVRLIGEARPYLSLLAVLNRKRWQQFAADNGIGSDAAAARTPATEKLLLARVAAQMKEFPGYAQVRKLTAVLEPWTVEDGLMTPTLKLKRPRISERFNAEIDQMYSGH